MTEGEKSCMILSALRRIRNRALSPSQLRCQHSLRYDCHRQSWIFEIRCAAHHPRQRGPKGAAQKPAPSEGAERGGYSKTPSSERAKAFFDRLTPLRKGRRFSAGAYCSPSGKKIPLTIFSLFSRIFLTRGFRGSLPLSSLIFSSLLFSWESKIYNPMNTHINIPG